MPRRLSFVYKRELHLIPFFGWGMATLGMINLAQNSTVRIVSVVAVLFSPPTLIASIYGMNFHVMPELDKPWGYPLALGLMLLSAGGTFLYFKWKKWL